MASSSNPVGGAVTATPQKEESEKADWVKRGAIVMLVAAIVFAGFAFLCFRGTFPKELLGGPLGVGLTFIVGLTLGVTGGLTFYFRKKQKDAEQETAQPS